MMELDYFLLGMRVCLHLATFLVIASYYDPTARQRRLVSVVAIMIAGPSFSAGTWTLLSMIQGAPNCPTPDSGPLFLLYAALFVAVVQTRGNVAKLFPRMPWSYRQ